MTDPFCSNEAVMGTIFYKGNYTMALYNIRPILPGHSLFIPIRHITRITELNDDEAKDLIRTMKKVVPVLTDVYGSEDDSYNLAVQSGESSGRTIDHLHVHIIPRKPGDRYQQSGELKVDISESLKDLGPEHVKREVARLRKRFGFTAAKI